MFRQALNIWTTKKQHNTSHFKVTYSSDISHAIRLTFSSISKWLTAVQNPLSLSSWPYKDKENEKP